MPTPRQLDRHPEVDRLRKALRAVIADRGMAIRDVGDQMGVNLYSVLKAAQFLRAEHVFRVLDVLGKPPAEFFAELYRLRPPADEEHRIAGIPQSEIEATVRRLVRAELEDDRREKRSGGNGGES